MEITHNIEDYINPGLIEWLEKHKDHSLWFRPNHKVLRLEFFCEDCEIYTSLRLNTLLKPGNSHLWMPKISKDDNNQLIFESNTSPIIPQACEYLRDTYNIKWD